MFSVRINPRSSAQLGVKRHFGDVMSIINRFVAFGPSLALSIPQDAIPVLIATTPIFAIVVFVLWEWLLDKAKLVVGFSADLINWLLYKLHHLIQSRHVRKAGLATPVLLGKILVMWQWSLNTAGIAVKRVSARIGWLGHKVQPLSRPHSILAALRNLSRRSLRAIAATYISFRGTTLRRKGKDKKKLIDDKNHSPTSRPPESGDDNS
jgi:hypothetical protein